MSREPEECLELAPGHGALDGRRDAKASADGSLSEVVLPVECSVEAIPGLWQTGAQEGFVLLTATEEDVSLHPRDVVAEVCAGLVETAACAYRNCLQNRASGSPSLLSMRSPASPADPLRGSWQGAFKDAPLARGPSGAERSEDRSYLPPCCSVRPGELHWRECLAGNPGPGPFSRHLLVQLHCARPVVGSARGPCVD